MNIRPRVWVLSLLLATLSTYALADRNMSGQATIASGQKETIKNLIYVGPLRKTDRKFVIKEYRIVASPQNSLSYTFIVTHADGSTEIFPAAEGNHLAFERLFAGVGLDLKITRISGDSSNPISVRIRLHTRTEGEDNFP